MLKRPSVRFSVILPQIFLSSDSRSNICVYWGVNQGWRGNAFLTDKIVDRNIFVDEPESYFGFFAKRFGFND